MLKQYEEYETQIIDYFNERQSNNNTYNLSCHNITKKLHIPMKKVTLILNKSDSFIKSNPIVVGSNKHFNNSHVYHLNV